MINFDQEIKSTLIDVTIKLVNGEMKTKLRQQFVGGVFIKRLEIIHRHICELFDITDISDQKDLMKEINLYWKDLEVKEGMHFKDTLKGDLSWL